MGGGGGGGGGDHLHLKRFQGKVLSFITKNARSQSLVFAVFNSTYFPLLRFFNLFLGVCGYVRVN